MVGFLSTSEQLCCSNNVFVQFSVNKIRFSFCKHSAKWAHGNSTISRTSVWHS